MTFNTGNPVGSTDARDLYDNAQNFDLLSVGPEHSYPDRLGNPRKSLAGRDAEWTAFLAASGFEPVVLQYIDGSPLTVDRPTQMIERVSAPGLLYSVKLPASFPAILSGTWAADEAMLVIRVDDSLREELAAPTGSNEVGHGAGTVGDVLAGIPAVQETVTRLDYYASWQFDPDLVALQETKHVVPVAGGGAFIDTRYDLAKELSFQRIPTRFTRHVGLTSTALENPDGSFMLITRQALGHANQTGASIVQYKTRYGSKVVPNFETSTVLDNAGVDDRDMSIGYMAGGRIGMVSSRPFAEQKPVFTYSDDNGATWVSAEITTAPDVWTTWFGIHPWPASAGGSDTGGYICYGNTQGATPSEISCLYTTDNGATWTHAICLSGLGAEQPSEASVARVGDADLWVMVYRQNATTTGKARWSFSTDMLTWSAPVDGGLTMGKNPPYLFWHEGHMYLFVASRNSAFFGNISPDARYANKLSYARTTAKKLVAGDLSDFDVLEPIASFGSLNGYLTLTRSPLTGKVFGAINYDEKSDGLVSSLSERSSLALVTDEKIVSPADALIGSSIAFSGGTSWRVTRDQAAGILRAVGVSITLTSDGSGNRLFKSVAFPVTFQSADLETIPVLKGLTPGGSTVTRQGLGQLIVENVTTTGCDISLYRISAAGAFVSDSTAVVQLAVEGGYVRNDY